MWGEHLIGITVGGEHVIEWTLVAADANTEADVMAVEFTPPLAKESWRNSYQDIQLWLELPSPYTSPMAVEVYDQLCRFPFVYLFCCFSNLHSM